jgi:hypothetical protein
MATIVDIWDASTTDGDPWTVSATSLATPALLMDIAGQAQRVTTGTGSWAISFALVTLKTCTFGVGPVMATPGVLVPGISYDQELGETRVVGAQYGQPDGDFNFWNNRLIHHAAGQQNFAMQVFVKYDTAQTLAKATSRSITYNSGWVSTVPPGGPATAPLLTPYLFVNNNHGAGTVNVRVSAVTIQHSLTEAEIDDLVGPILVPNVPIRAGLAVHSTIDISHARIRREHRNEEQAKLFHNYVKVLST